MAQYFTDFSEYATGQQPSDWTTRFATPPAYTVVELEGATGGKALNIGTRANSRSGLSWDLIDADPARADCEVLIKFRFRTITGNTEFCHMSRGSGSAGSETLYRMTVRENELRSAWYKSGTYGDASAAVEPFTAVAGTWYWMRVQNVGASQKLRVWEDGDAEPALWDIETTDVGISGPGWVGIFRFQQEVEVDVDAFGVGTGGDPAPSSPVLPPIYTTGDVSSPSQIVNSDGSPSPLWSYIDNAPDGESTDYITRQEGDSGPNRTAVLALTDMPADFEAINGALLARIDVELPDGSGTRALYGQVRHPSLGALTTYVRLYWTGEPAGRYLLTRTLALQPAGVTATRAQWNEAVVHLVWEAEAGASGQLRLYGLELGGAYFSAEGGGTTPVGNGATLQWNIRETLGATTTVQWTVLQNVAQDSDQLWNVLALAQADTALQWSLLERVSADTTAKWNTLQNVEADTALQWSLRNAVHQDTALLWSLRALVGQTATLSWDVETQAGTVGNSLTAHWSILEAIAAQLDIPWDVLNAVGVSRSLMWGVLEGVAQAVQAQWDVRALAGQDITISWDVIGVVGQTVTMNWNVNGAGVSSPILTIVIPDEARAIVIPDDAREIIIKAN